MSNPFPVRRKSRKPRKDREYGDGRVRLASKSDLRRQAYERAEGKCEKKMEDEPGQFVRCNRTAPWDGSLTVRGHLAHKRHGIHRDDTLAGVLWECADCHLNGDHGSKCTYPRRAGKVMTSAKAKAYWQGAKCFCEGDKVKETSFCPTCVDKLPYQLRYDLMNTQWDDYLKVLAECETAIMKFDVEHK